MRVMLAIIALSGSVAMAAEVTEIKINALDGFTGGTESVVSRCRTRVGAEYDPQVLSRDVVALKDSGEFVDISADAQDSDAGVTVVFSLRRKMRLTEAVGATGCEFFNPSRIAREAGLKAGELYGEADIAAAATKVRQAYRKRHYPDAKVTPQIDCSAAGDAIVTFQIEEGLRQRIRAFRFEGADNVDPRELHQAINDYPWWNPMGWFSDAPATADELAGCCAKLAAVYRRHGYLDAEVTGPERLSDGEGNCDVVFKVAEGPQYRVGTVKIEGLTRYPEGVVATRSELPASGEVAGEGVLADAAERIRVTVGSGDSGLADTVVETRRIPAAEDGVIDVVYKVTEGVPVVIDEVRFRGNDYTQDKVLRREVALGPGDRMLADRAERSKRRLENLDYFSRVSYALEPSKRGKNADGAEYRNLVYEVEEKNTGSFMVGIGASSVDSVYLSAEVNQNNFDLFAPSKLFRGGGQKARLYVAWGPRYQSVELGFTEPHFLGRLLEFNFDAYRRLRWYDEYDLIRSGGQVSFTYPVKFWPTWSACGRLGIGVSGEVIEFDDTDSGEYVLNGEASQLFREEEREYGDAFEPVLHLFWSRDNRDNYRMPTRGHRTRVSVDLAPAGDNQYWRLGVNHRSYFNVWPRYGHVLMCGIRAETIDAFSDDVPIYNRMFLGGPRSVRGIEYRHVAPMVRKEDSNSYAPWGGQSLCCLNFEYTVPIVKMLRLAVFSDIGSVGEDVCDLDFSDTFAWTAGIGIRLDVPMFPIRLDFAAPIKKPDHAEKECFSFTVGYEF